MPEPSAETRGMESQSSATLVPTLPQERIEVLDILRGLAIFGILWVNMMFFNSPAFYLQTTGETWFNLPVDRVAEYLIRMFAQSKFYTLFSFLFGLGFMIQLERATARGAAFASLFRRRLFALLLIGLVHAFLIWMGDILVFYAVLGFFLFFFRRRKPKTLLIWAVVLLLIPMVVMAAIVGAIEIGRSSPVVATEIEKAFAEQGEGFRYLLESSRHAYAEGSFDEIMVQRAADVFFIYQWFPFGAPGILGMFLLGAYAERRGFFRDLPAHLPLFRKVWWWGLAIGLPANLIFTISFDYINPGIPSPLGLLSTAALTIGGPAFCFFYIASLVLLVQKPNWKRRLSPLGAVGRMALTNYLLQSVVCTTLFYSYGFGLYGQVGPALGLGLTFVIYFLQIPFSQWWLRRFRFGPMEWVWRTLTYGKLQPMRLAALTPAAESR